MKVYETHVFDVDGTLLDTNGLKSEAFYQAALPYGERAAREMVRFHQQAGSITRRGRWEHFFAGILGREPEDGELDSVIDACTAHVAGHVASAAKVDGAEDYLASLTARKLAVSGIEKAELGRILDAHDLRRHFDGVFSGPKRALLSELVGRGVIVRPAAYYGDTEDDYLSARLAGMDFVWVAGCSEWEGVRTVRDFRELLAS